MAFDSAGNVYVADTLNNRIQKFDANGAYVMQWGTAGAGAGQFAAPTGIAVSAGNQVYVIDLGNSRVQRFTTSGAFQMQFGSLGVGPGQFNFPYDIAIDSGRRSLRH